MIFYLFSRKQSKLIASFLGFSYVANLRQHTEVHSQGFINILSTSFDSGFSVVVTADENISYNCCQFRGCENKCTQLLYFLFRNFPYFVFSEKSPFLKEFSHIMISMSVFAALQNFKSLTQKRIMILRKNILMFMSVNSNPCILKTS